MLDEQYEPVIQAVQNSDLNSFKKTFEPILAAKLSTAIENKKEEILSLSLVGEPEDNSE